MLRGFGTMIDLKTGASRQWVVGADGVQRWHDDGQPTDGPWGRGDLMATAAVRYCLGRMTYIVGDCVDWLFAQWPNLSDGCRKTIARDVDEAFERDNDARERGDQYKPLGHDCDRKEWERARSLWQSPNAKFTGAEGVRCNAGLDAAPATEKE